MLSAATVPASLKRIELEVHVAGRSIAQTFPPLPNQKTVFAWDGLDELGRRLQGRQGATASVRWVYEPLTVGQTALPTIQMCQSPEIALA